MKARSIPARIIAVLVCAPAATLGHAQAQEAATTGEMETKPSEELAREATDPTASLMSLQFIGGYVGGYYGDQGELDDDRSELKLRFDPERDR